MKNNSIAIVVVTYNRYKSFERLIRSISKIKTEERDITLVISIDYHEKNQDIINLVEEFEWLYGEKQLIVHKNKQGLKNHIIGCGDLTSAFESVIVLEDDLMVSPYFYDYAREASQFYKNEDNIAGISLYSYERAESANFTFKPLYDGYDAFFMQFPSSWGQCWTRKQWQGFKQWLLRNDSEDTINQIVPNFVEIWPKTSWKKLFVAYMISQDKYFVFPKIGLSTNFGDIGQHHINQLNIRQIDLLSNKLEFHFPKFNQTNSKYDVGFELKYEELVKLNPELLKLPKFDVDFYCKKKHKENDIILTVAKTKNKLYSFSGRLFPLINNIIFNLDGDNLVLTKYKDVKLESVIVDKTKFSSEIKFLFREILRLFYYKLKPNK